jgi:hypothetical protein
MKKSYLKYLDDEVGDELSQEEELLKLRQQRLEQAALRLEQRERHLKLQEEKTRLLEEKRRAEEVERRRLKLKKVFTAFIKGVGSVAAVASSIVALLSYLRQEAQCSTEAARAYRSIINILEQMLAAIKSGGNVSKRAFISVFDKLSEAVKYVWNNAKQRFVKSESLIIHDSAILVNCIRRDIAFKLGSKKLITDSSYIYLSNRYSDIASDYVDRALRICDRKYVDLFPLAIPAGITLTKATIVPLLLTILKAGAISGVAGAIKGPLMENITKPICTRIINNIKLAAANKKPDQSYLQAIGGKISSDMDTLIDILNREKSFIGSKLESAWNKVKGLFKK